ncbi:MAG: tRNA pseudouridine(38-40) synthase TruA [Burkholderiales bacterium]
MRIALGLEYDGGTFCGWQTQRAGCSVQDTLEKALSAIAGAPVSTVAAGRTDSGVHALAQVVHFDVAADRPLSAWLRGVNTLLPSAVCVHWVRAVDAEFHARFHAVERCYRYLLLNHAARPALFAGKVGWCHAPLQLDAMQQAAQHLLGSHDFSAFRCSECQAETPLRELRGAHIRQHGTLYVYEFRANAFLQHMVRNIVGCLVEVGKGKRPVSWIADVLESRQRRFAAPTFDAAGLYFVGACYDPKWGLPSATERPDGATIFEQALKAIPATRVS